MERIRLKKPKRGRFRPGVSGNPGGRPKTPDEITALLRSGLPAAVRTVIRLASYSKNENIRLAAAKEILDRNLGKPAIAEAPPEAAREIGTGQNVVRVPYPAQSTEQWEKEAQAWRDRHPPPSVDEAQQFLRENPPTVHHQGDPTKIN